MALSRDPWPETARQAANAFDNQFQLPMLVYAAGAIAIYLGAGWLEAGLLWLFVLTRYAHAFIHCTSNNVLQRFSAYISGFVLLTLLWLVLIVRVLFGLGG